MCVADELMLQAGRDAAFASLITSFTAATGYGAEWALCPLANVTICSALEAAVPSVLLQVRRQETPANTPPAS